MIVSLRGSLDRWDAESSTAWIEVGGVGYEVLIPAFAHHWIASEPVGEEMKLFTYYHVSERQPAPLLIGFQHHQEREFFRKFINVPEVGPQKAVRALTFPVSEIARWIEAEDVAALRQLPGIGQRLSQTIVANLHGKLTQEALLRSESGAPPARDAARALYEDAVRRARGVAVLAPRGRAARHGHAPRTARGRRPRGAAARGARAAGAGLGGAVSVPRDRWPTMLGLLGAGLLLLGFGGQLRGIEWVSGSFLGLDLGAWSLATTFLAVFLIVQIVLNARVALERERRLVDVAADLRETSAELERLAKVDPLTNVLNRRALFERVGAEFRRSQRYGRPLTAVMIDIDHFKALNERYGHATGDAVLAVCAREMASSLRESDGIGRYGGEEFVVFLPETTLADGAVVAEKLRLAIEELRIDGPDGASEPVQVTISAGVASTPELGIADEQALVRRADGALYEAKRGGRNRVAVAEIERPRRAERQAS